MAKYLTNSEVAEIIQKTLDHFKLPRLTRDELRSLFIAVPVPIIKYNEKVQVWLDKEYVAYSRIDDDEVHYVYITLKHLKEERKQGTNPVIYKSYIDALFRMVSERKNYAKFAI